MNDGNEIINVWFELRDQMLIEGKTPSGARPPSLRDACYAYALANRTAGMLTTEGTIESFVNGLELGALSALRDAWENRLSDLSRVDPRAFVEQVARFVVPGDDNEAMRERVDKLEILLPEETLDAAVVDEAEDEFLCSETIALWALVRQARELTKSTQMDEARVAHVALAIADALGAVPWEHRDDPTSDEPTWYRDHYMAVARAVISRCGSV
jgi:hypothetical protein